MSRYETSQNHVLYNPTVLRLNSFAHRATLEGNQVSLLSGVDPKFYGAKARMPGGKRVSANFPTTPGSKVARAYPLYRRGIQGGNILKTTVSVASNITKAGGAQKLYVTSTDGWHVGDHFFCYEPDEAGGARNFSGYISVIGTDTTSGKFLTVNPSNTGGSKAESTQPGDIVLRISPFYPAATLNTKTTIAAASSRGLSIGMTVMICGNFVTGWSSTAEHQITNISKAGAVTTITWDPAPSFEAVGGSFSHVIIPTRDTFEQAELLVSQDNGDIHSFHAGSWNEIWDASDESFAVLPWSATLYDRSALLVNGHDRPIRLNESSVIYDPTVTGQEPPISHVGFPNSQVATDPFANGGVGGMVAGDYKVFVRLLDTAVNPIAKTPPLGKTTVTMGGANGIRFNTLLFFQELALEYQRCMDYEIWMTAKDGVSYYLVENGHVSRWQANSVFITTYDLDLLDATILLGDLWDTEDEKQGLMPNGKYIHYSQGVSFIAGTTDDDADDIHPTIDSGNVVRFSRTDREEPENFPPDNIKIVGNSGDDVRGFVDAGDVTLILSRSSFTLARRAGTFLLFEDGGGTEYGLAHEYAYCSMGSSAAWIGYEQVWIFDGLTLDKPKDIGFYIKDWLKFVSHLPDDLRVRIRYDSTNRLLWVTYSPTSTTYGSVSAMVYSVDDDAWTKREAMYAEELVAARNIEFAASKPYCLYRISEGNVFRVIDYDNSPVMDGGFNSNLPVSGTLSAGQVTTLLASGYMAITSNAEAADNAFRGLAILFSDGQLRVITASTAIRLDVAAMTVAAGVTWIVGLIPFRLRFPPIRGDDPFVGKVALGAQVMLDDIDYGAVSTQTATMAVKLLRNYVDTLNTGASGSFALTDGVAKVDPDYAEAIRLGGKVLELQLEQLDRHVGFSVLYAGVIILSSGNFSEDRSSLV